MENKIYWDMYSLPVHESIYRQDEYEHLVGDGSGELKPEMFNKETSSKGKAFYILKDEFCYKKKKWC